MVGFTLVTQPRTIADEAWFNSTQCYREYCFNPSLTRTTCTATLGYFVDHLNEHRGACVRNLYTMSLPWNERKKTCESMGTGWIYFSGVQWTRGRLNTQASCESGACTYDLSTAKLMSEQLVDATLEINQCDAKGFCNRKCEGCRSLIRGESKVCAPCVFFNFSRCAFTETKQCAIIHCFGIRPVVDASIAVTPSIRACKSKDPLLWYAIMYSNHLWIAMLGFR
jgi:hypothetical protein